MRRILPRYTGVFIALSLFVALFYRAAQPAVAYADPQETYSVRVPILMYHYVRTVLDRRDKAGLDLSVTPAHFAQQMALLHEKGFHTVTFDDLLSAIYDGTRLPPNPIIL